MLIVIRNLTRVLDVKHKFYTSYLWSKHYQAVTHNQMVSPPIVLSDLSADIKNCLRPTLTKQLPQAGYIASLLPVFPLLKNVLSKLHTFISTLSISGLRTFKSGMSYATSFSFNCYAERLKEIVPLKIHHKV